MKTTSEDVKNFYNANFFEKGKSKGAKIAIVIKTGEQMIMIPTMEVFPENSIHEIFNTFHTHLLENGPVDFSFFGEAAKPIISEAPAPGVPIPVVTDVIQYRTNYYQIEEYNDEKYIITRKDTRKIIPEKMPVWNAIVKMYKEGANRATDE